MDSKELKKEIQCYKENGMNSLPVRDLVLYNIKKIDKVEHTLIKLTTKFEDHLLHHQDLAKKRGQLITWGVSLMALIVAAFSYFK